MVSSRSPRQRDPYGRRNPGAADAQPLPLRRQRARGESRSLGCRRGQRQRDDAARVAAGTMVDERTAVLGRLLGRWRAWARVGGARSGRRGLPAADRRARRDRRLHVPSELAFPEPHAGPVRLGRGRAARGARASAITTARVSPTRGPRRCLRPAQLSDLEKRTRLLCRGDAGEHDSGRDQGRRDGQPVNPRDAYLLPHRRRRVPRLRRLRRHERLLLRQLHARLELRGRHRSRLPRAGAIAAPGRVRLLDGSRRRHALPAASAGRRRPVPHRGRRRADGPDHEGLSGLAAVGRRRVAGGSLAEGEARDRLCLDSERVGCRSRRRARGRAAQHLRHRVLRAQPALRHLLSRRAARGRGDGRRDGRRGDRARRAAAVRVGPDVDRRAICSTASTTCSRSRGSRARAFRTRC